MRRRRPIRLVCASSRRLLEIARGGQRWTRRLASVSCFHGGGGGVVVRADGIVFVAVAVVAVVVAVFGPFL